MGRPDDPRQRCRRRGREAAARGDRAARRGLDGGAFDGRPIAAADEPTFRVEIELTNKDQVGAVIGEGGRTINYIRALAAVDIQVERPSEVREGSTQRRVVITGGESGCQKAKGLVQEVLKSNTGKRDYSQKIDASAASEASGGLVRLSIPRHLVGRIIGTRGATIRRLRDITGAVIDVAKDESGVGTVTINGSPGQVRSAREQIEELTQEDLPLEVQQTLSRMLEEVLVFSAPPTASARSSAPRGRSSRGCASRPACRSTCKRTTTAGRRSRCGGRWRACAPPRPRSRRLSTPRRRATAFGCDPDEQGLSNNNNVHHTPAWWLRCGRASVRATDPLVAPFGAPLVWYSARARTGTPPTLPSRRASIRRGISASLNTMMGSVEWCCFDVCAAHMFAGEYPRTADVFMV